MRKRISIDISATDRQHLLTIVTDRNSPQKHVWRAQIVLLTVDGCGTMELTRRTGTSKTSVWRWQQRFLAEGVPGLLRDKTRPARIPPLGTDVEARVVAATQTKAPGNHPLDLGRNGSPHRHQRQFGAACLAQAWSPAA